MSEAVSRLAGLTGNTHADYMYFALDMLYEVRGALPGKDEDGADKQTTTEVLGEVTEDGPGHVGLGRRRRVLAILLHAALDLVARQTGVPRGSEPL